VRTAGRNPELPVTCPGCGAATEIACLGRVEVDLCPVCMGIWFDRDELVELPTTLADPEMAKAAIEALGSLGNAARNGHRPAYLQCPVCAKHMTRRNYRRVSGILTDHCERCGTWIDRESIQRILHLVAANRIGEIDHLATKADREDALRAAELEAQHEQSERAAALVRMQTGMSEVRGRQDSAYQEIADLFYDVLRPLL
jgi:Zn-finger nucleic acid-binding protein